MPGDPRLQYQAVNAPDFTTALQALQGAGRSFDSFGSDAENIVNKVQDARTADVNKQYQDLLNQFSDPTQAQAAITADPTLGLDRRYLTSASLAAGGSRAADLMALANTKVGYQKTAEDLAQTELTRGYENTDTANYRAAQPLINQYTVLKGQGKNDEANAILQDPTMQKLAPDRLQNVLAGGSGARQSELGLKTGESSADLQVYNNLKSQTDSKNGVLADGLVEEGMRSVSDPTQAAKWFADNYDSLMKRPGMNAQVIQAARGKMIDTLSKLPAPPASLVPSAMGGSRLDDGPSNDGGYDSVYGDTAKGNTYGIHSDRNISSMTAGEVYDFGREKMTPATKAAGVGVINGKTVGTTAVGRYQIEGSTLARIAPKVLGADWRGQPFNAANQDKLGKALYEEAVKNGTNLHNVWSSIPASQSKAIAAAGWDSAKNTIAQGESGGSLSGSQAANNAAGAVGVVNPLTAKEAITQFATGAQLNLQRDPNMKAVSDYQALGGDLGTNAATVAQKLTAKGGALEGENTDYVLTRLTNIMHDNPNAQLKASMAGAILANARSGYKNLAERAVKNIGLGDGLNTKIDDNLIAQNVGYFADKTKLQNSISTLTNTNNSVAGAQASLDALNQARAAYMAAKTKGPLINGKPNDLTPYANNVKIAERALMSYGAQVQGLDAAGDNKPEAAARQDKSEVAKATEVLHNSRPVAFTPAPQHSIPASQINSKNFASILARRAAGIGSGSILQKQ